MGIEEVEPDVLTKAGSNDTRKLLLLDVLHVPGLICNIYSVTRTINWGMSLSFAGQLVHCSLRGDLHHFAEKYEGLYRLARPATSKRPSKLIEGENCVLAYDWPMPERHAWDMKKQQMQQEEKPAISVESSFRRSPSPKVTPSNATRPVTNRCPGCGRICLTSNGLGQHRQAKRH